MTVVKGLSGVFYATDILMGHKPFYEKPKTKPKDDNFKEVFNKACEDLKKK